MKKILFLCTANYYRSRFAELLFNHLAEKQQLKWQAESRGIALGKGIPTIGAISWFTTRKLKNKQVTLPEKHRFPLQVKLEDFQNADIIIAMNETDHRALMKERFPEWQEKVEYWSIPDSHQGLPLLALKKLEANVLELLERLADN